MGKVLWLLNFVLLIAAATTTSWMKQQNPVSRWSARRSDIEAYGADADTDGTQIAAPAGWRQASIPQDAVNDLWRVTLFRPERKPQLEAAVEAAAQQAAPGSSIKMELKGIGRIGGKPKAIITVATRAQPRGRAAARGKAAPEPTPAKDTRHVYGEGDEVETTGYIVKEVLFREVLLQRGDEERVLSLDTDDVQSQTRRDMAAKEEARTAAAALAKSKAKTVAAVTPKILAGGTKNLPPPPPPPPVAAPGGKSLPTPSKTAAAATAVAPSQRLPMTKEERIKRAQEIRERILQMQAAKGK